MDLVKQILLELEKTTPGTIYNSESLSIEGYTAEQVHFHMYLMKQAGLIDGEDVTGAGVPIPEVIPFWMTWEGYEFLEAARNDGIWDRVKGDLQERGLGLAFETLKAALLRASLQQLGIGA